MSIYLVLFLAGMLIFILSAASAQLKLDRKHDLDAEFKETLKPYVRGAAPELEEELFLDPMWRHVPGNIGYHPDDD